MNNNPKAVKITSMCKKGIIALVDLSLYFFANACIVYLTMGGHIRATEYSNILLMVVKHGKKRIMLSSALFSSSLINGLTFIQAFGTLPELMKYREILFLRYFQPAFFSQRTG